MGWGFENYCYLCSLFIGSGGGIGRHAGLKIPWAEMPVRVRFPSRTGSIPVPSTNETCGNSSVGRARPCQGRGREFEPRFPLKRVPEYPGPFLRRGSDERPRTPSLRRVGEVWKKRELAAASAAGSSLVFRSKGFRNIRDPFFAVGRI